MFAALFCIWSAVVEMLGGAGSGLAAGSATAFTARVSQPAVSAGVWPAPLSERFPSARLATATAHINRRVDEPNWRAEKNARL